MIRLATPADAARVAAVYRPGVEHSAASFEEVAPGPEEMARRIEATLAMHPWIVMEAAGTVAGYAYASPHHARAGYRWSVNVSVYVDDAHQGRGIGRALYTSLFAILRAQGFVNAYAGIALPNAASVGLHESLGFALVGIYTGVGYKLGAWRDVGWWHRLLAPLPADPVPPRPLPEMPSHPAWPALLAAGTDQAGRP
ncbi:MAG: arsinothricin resistance N-acetyltransferase ArsN1 family B [Vicinamibacterales bacterium]